MKVKLITIALLFATSLMGMENKTVRTDGDKHVLTDLWNQYEAAVKADLPQTQFQVLSSITEEASRRRLHWDFYDAASRKVEVGASRNWKLRDSLQKAFTKEVKDYDEPLVTYVWRRKSLGGDQSAFVLANKEALSGGRNDAFYGVSGVSSALYGQLGDLVRNDYEFALWSEFLTGKSGAEKELTNVLGDRYPEAAFLKYRHLIRFRTGFEREKALKAFSSEYAGKAIALLADATLLCDEKSSLDRNRKTSEVQYKDFYRRCQAFEKVRKGYTSGVDAKIAAGVKEVGALVEELESRWVQIDFQKDTALIQLRNLDKVEVRLLTDAKKPKTLLKRVFQNASGRFYVPDTLRLALPRRDDGTCVLEAWNGKEKASAVISSYSLAIASRNDGDGLGVYVADTRTGQPLPKVDFELYRSGERVAKAKNVMLDGFTHLPAAITDKIEGDAIHMLVATVRGADGFLRRSEDLMFNPSDRWTGRRTDDASESFCRIFTDRGAYRPGETLCYKAVFYAGDARRSLHVAQEGTPVRVELLNAESQSVGVANKEASPLRGGLVGSSVEPSDLEELASQRDLVAWDTGQDCLLMQREWRIGRLLLRSKPIHDAPRDQQEQVICDAVTKNGLSLLSWSDEVSALQRRVALVAAWHPELNLPDLSTSHLLVTAHDWLPYYIYDGERLRTTGAALRKIDLCAALWSLIPYDLQQHIDRLAPSHIVVPTGSHIRLDYRVGAEAPVLSVRLQECFGMKETPRVNDGKVPVLMELLSPGYKPVQLTSDLSSFWQSTYFEVRSELRRRYPKHYWPDNPLEAEPTAKVKKLKR